MTFLDIPVITYGMALYINDSYSMYTDKTLTLTKSMYICERASLENVLAFLHSKTAISFNILLVLARYFVGTNDVLLGLHVATNFLKFENSEKTLLSCGGGRLYWMAPCGMIS